MNEATSPATWSSKANLGTVIDCFRGQRRRSSAVPSDTAETAPTMRDQHLQTIAERGWMAWQKDSGSHWRALVEADISRFKLVVGDGLRSHADQR